MYSTWESTGLLTSDFTHNIVYYFTVYTVEPQAPGSYRENNITPFQRFSTCWSTSLFCSHVSHSTAAIWRKCCCTTKYTQMEVEARPAPPDGPTGDSPRCFGSSSPSSWLGEQQESLEINRRWHDTPRVSPADTLDASDPQVRCKLKVNDYRSRRCFSNTP